MDRAAAVALMTACGLTAEVAFERLEAADRDGHAPYVSAPTGNALAVAKMPNKDLTRGEQYQVCVK